MERVDTIVVGAGVVGLAVARALGQRGREVLILEAEEMIGSITSSRNSGVIHAGIYYQPGSLKARLCVDGRHRLYRYAAERGIPHKQCGKLIVATSEDQVARLHEWHAIALKNGVEDMRVVTRSEARAMEPEVSCVAAIHVPVTGIIDVHNYMLALEGDAEAAGATVVLRSPVLKGEVTADGFMLEIGGEAPMQITCKNLVNAAGLGAQSLARALRGLDPNAIPPLVLAKGNYFSLNGTKPPFEMLIYPLPDFGSSGLHASCDMGGQARFGPDIEWVDRIDYKVNPDRLSAFEEAVRRYWPGLPSGALHPDYSGIRPKLARGGPHDTDFIIQTARDHEVPGLINLFGIESPGLTSSLALADEVAASVGPI